MPQYSYFCPECATEFDVIKSWRDLDRAEVCSLGHPAERLVTMPSTYVMTGNNSASTSPKRHANAEPRRKEAKRERVTNMLERLHPDRTTNNSFQRPAGPRKGIKLW
jgi:putative FmdB family regulatory protein